MHVHSSGSSVGRAVDCSRCNTKSVIHRSLVQIRPGGNFFSGSMQRAGSYSGTVGQECHFDDRIL